MTITGNCPGCGRHCDLSAPGCGCGREYALSGVLPERRHGEEGPHGPHGRHAPHGHRPDRPDSDINGALIASLRDVGHLMRMQYEGKASQKRILILLSESEALTQKELTERLGIQPGSASEILAKLENADLIARVPNDADRRTTDVRLTEHGRALALEAAAQRRQRHEEMFACLSGEEKARLLALLEKLRADWEQRLASLPPREHPGHHGAHDGSGEGRRHGHPHPHE